MGSHQPKLSAADIFVIKIDKEIGRGDFLVRRLNGIRDFPSPLSPSSLSIFPKSTGNSYLCYRSEIDRSAIGQTKLSAADILVIKIDKEMGRSERGILFAR